MKKKVLSLLLCLALTASSLTAVGAAETDASASETAEETEAEDGGAAEAKEESEAAEAKEAEAEEEAAAAAAEAEGEAAAAAEEAEAVEAAEEEAAEETGETEGIGAEEAEAASLSVLSATHSSAADAIASATTASVGTTYTGTAYYYDAYQYTLSSSGGLNVSAAASDYIAVSVYDSSDTSSYLDRESSSTGSVSITFDLTVGTYYVVVYSSNVSYTLSTTFTSASESFSETSGGSNNSASAASSISTGNTYYGQIALNDTQDWYKFTLSASGCVKLTSTLNTDEYGTYFYLYSSDAQTQLWYDYAYSDDPAADSLDLTSGTYYLVILSKYDTGNYSFKLSFTSAGESFAETQGGNNNSKSTADSISTGKTYKGQIALNDATDWYKFTLSKKTTLTLSVLTYGTVAADFYIYKSDGTTKKAYKYVYSDSSTEKGAGSTTFTLAKGTYYLKVYSGSTTYHSGKYTFKIGNDIASVTLSSYVLAYSGKNKTPSVTVLNTNGTKLKKGTNYTLSWSSSSRKAIGTYTVTVTGKGSYIGSKTISFTIIPKTVSIKSSTKSSAKKKITVKWSKVSGSVTGYEIRYRKKGSSSWTTKTVSSSKSSLILTGLTSGKKYEIQVRAYKKVLSDSGSTTTYNGSWSSTKTVKVK